jgi:hypothetical protein
MTRLSSLTTLVGTFIFRYEKLAEYVHLIGTVNPARGQPGHDPIHKVRPIIEMAVRNCQAKYDPHREVSVDEAMVSFRGRLAFKQYMPAKPIKWGIKIWELADSHNGYVLNLQVYTGKPGGGIADAGRLDVGLGHRVVDILTQPFQNHYHHVYIDNFFNSVDLLEDLERNGTYACGTVRLNRLGLPDRIKKANIRIPGTSVKMQKGNMLAVVWFDKRKVGMLSTCQDPHDIIKQRRHREAPRDRANVDADPAPMDHANVDANPAPIGPAQPPRQDGQQQPRRRRRRRRNQPARQNGEIYNISKPICIENYNQFMGGVDKSDQMRSYYPVGRSAKKWWKYLMWFVVELCIANAYVLYTETLPGPSEDDLEVEKKDTFMKFSLSIAKGLIGGFSNRRKGGRRANPRGVVVHEANMGAHELVRRPRGGRKRHCVQCKVAHRRTVSGRAIECVFMCNLCKVALCATRGCFAEFHAHHNA